MDTFALHGGGILESGLGPLLTPLVSFGISIISSVFGFFKKVWTFNAWFI